ncbi:MAG: beta-lactamase family protein [Bacteroidales bacterium]|nr:beta-lactamase family protein [Bacteroidales bacterium]
MKATLILIASLFIVPGITYGQSENLNRRIDQYFLDVHKAVPAPGFSVVVVKEGKVIFTKGFGVERIGSQKPFTRRTSTAIGSLTKSFTSMAIMQLVEQEKVVLDDPVIRYLPEFRTANKNRSDKITVRMLLNNTSSLYGGVSQNFGNTDQSLERLMVSLQSIYLKKEPGSSYEYSNTAFSLAGLIISRVSGISYTEYLEQYLFHPLGMNRSTTDPDDFGKMQVLYGHHLGLDAGIPAERVIESGEMIPAGSMLRSSAEDLGHYLAVLQNGGISENQQILTPKSIESMWSPQIGFPGLSFDQGGDGKEIQYGLGWMISEVEGRTLVHHGGNTETMSSMTILYPEKQMAASILFNINYFSIDQHKFQSEFGILNNLFHLIEEEEATDFGTPRIPDPTLNDYQLPDSLKQRFEGVYRYAGSGGSSFLQNVELQIFPDPDKQLEVLAKRRKTEIMNFTMDFTNEVNAVSRNIGSPQSIHFKVRPDGVVTGLYFSGTEFIKLMPDFMKNYQLLEVGNSLFSFYFPTRWEATIHGDRFRAINTDDPSITVSGGQKTMSIQEIEGLVEEELPNHTVSFEGAEMTGIMGNDLWLQKSFLTLYEGETYQHLLLVNDIADFYMLISTPFGKLTTAVQVVTRIMMETFTSNSIAS